MRRLIAAVAAVGLFALTACSLTACTGAALQTKPTVIDTPAILWTVAPTSPLESDKYVQALRAADVGWALAVNLHDFSILQFTNTRDARSGVDGYESYLGSVFGLRGDDAADPFVILGPASWVPLSVSPNAGDNGASVEVCFAGTRTLSADGPSKVDTVGRLATFTVETDLESGILVKSNGGSGSTQECDASLAPVGRFSPVPTLPMNPDTGEAVVLTAGDVIPPPWFEDRCFTGWSKAGCNRGEDAR